MDGIADGAGCALDRAPATAMLNLFPRRSTLGSSRAKRSASPSFALLRPPRCRSIARRRQNRHRDRNQADLENERKSILTTIGNFTQTNDRFIGSVKTLSLSIKAEFVALKPSEKGPDFRVFSGEIEIGAAWRKSRKDGGSYLFVRLDDPTFASPIFASLVETRDGDHALIWSRRNAD